MLHCKIPSFCTQERSHRFKKIVCHTHKKKSFLSPCAALQNSSSPCPDFKERICPTRVLWIKINLWNKPVPCMKKGLSYLDNISKISQRRFSLLASAAFSFPFIKLVLPLRFHYINQRHTLALITHWRRLRCCLFCPPCQCYPCKTTSETSK